MKELKLEVGKTYLDRENRKVKIVRSDRHSTYPFDGDNNQCYTKDGFVHSKLSISSFDLISEYTEQTEFVLPEKWFVRPIDKESDRILVRYRDGGHGGHWSTSILISDKIWVNNCYSALGQYTEITFEQFKQHVLKQKTETTMEKKIIGYKLKDKQFTKAVSMIVFGYSTWAIADLDIFINWTDSQVIKLKEAEVLDLWFEPVYEEQFKVGDWVVVLESDKYYFNSEKIAQEIIEIESRDDLPYKLRFRDGQENSYSKIRLATPEEIAEAKKPKEEVINIGFDIRIKDGKAFHKNDNITEFIKEMFERFPANGTLDAYKFGIKDIEFSFTGCEKKTTRLSDWRKVYNKIK